MSSPNPDLWGVIFISEFQLPAFQLYPNPPFSPATTAAVWRMRLAFSSVMLAGLPNEEVCARAAKLGFGVIDIWCPFDNCKHLYQGFLSPFMHGHPTPDELSAGIVKACAYLRACHTRAIT